MLESTVYVETSVVGHLAGSIRTNAFVAARQRLSRRWWKSATSRFRLYISELVLEELAAGDPRAAVERIRIVRPIPILPVTTAARDLAAKYLSGLRLPAREARDALHIALAVAHRIDFLVTWNCAHIANGEVIRRLERLNRKLRRPTPVILTPEGLQDVEGEDGA